MKELLNVIHLTTESHPHEDDAYAFVDGDARIVQPVMETGKHYLVTYPEPVAYPGTEPLYITEAVGTLRDNDILCNSLVTVTDETGTVTGEREVVLFRFMFREGDALEEVVPAPDMQDVTTI